MKVIIQLRSTSPLHSAALASEASPSLTAHVGNAIAGLTLDANYPPVQIPNVKSVGGAAMHSLSQPLTFSFEAAESTYIVRGSIPDGALQAEAVASALAHPDVVGVFSDPLIESRITCGGSAAVGTAATVATRLSVSKLAAARMTGANVMLAIVDTGINVAYLISKGRNPKLDASKSFVPAGVATLPGQHPVNHGTMCAFDAGIAAPKARLLDYAVLLSKTPGSTVMAGLLSDAVLAYKKLGTLLQATPASKRAMVVSNSWGMFSPAWDFPPGHPGNYSDNPSHPFNIIVASLEALGADILFAAGNCGVDCPDGRCAFGTTPPICGANSHPRVLSIAGVDTKKNRVGYSSQGPGRLSVKKPDVASYTHFTGSGVFAPGPDSGTSAACPVAAGVVAAIRSRYPVSKLSPLQLRALIYKTAEDRGNKGFDFDYGYGILDPLALKAALP
ncbi:MAG: S8 family serine peptidase [Gammaproteobacteria bacterium]